MQELVDFFLWNEPRPTREGVGLGLRIFFRIGKSNRSRRFDYTSNLEVLY